MQGEDGIITRSFVHKNHSFLATIDTAKEPVVGTITDFRGKQVAHIELTQETLGDLLREEGGDPDRLFEALIEGWKSGIDNPPDR